MDNWTRKQKSFFNKYLNELLKNNISVILIAAENIKYDGDFKCVGLFDDNLKELTLATKDKNSFLTFVHEYCHYLQFANGEYQDIENDIYISDQWLIHKKDLNKTQVRKAMSRVAEMEYDCENKAVNLIKSSGLEDCVDVERYIKMANSYVYSYFAQLKTRQYSLGNSIIEDGIYSKQFLDIMPSKFLKFDEYKNVSKEYLNLYREFCKQKQ